MEKRKPEVQQAVKVGQNLITCANSDSTDVNLLRKEVGVLMGTHAELKELLQDQEAKLEAIVDKGSSFNSGMKDLLQWVNEANEKFADDKTISTNPNVVNKQLEHIEVSCVVNEMKIQGFAVVQINSAFLFIT